MYSRFTRVILALLTRTLGPGACRGVVLRSLEVVTMIWDEKSWAIHGDRIGRWDINGNISMEYGGPGYITIVDINLI